MKKIKDAIKFLFDQSKIGIGLAILISQFPAFADIEWAVMSPRVSESRATIGILVVELVACFIVLPVLLYTFKVAGRMKQILGLIPTAILLFVVWLIVMYTSKDDDKAGQYTLGITFFSIYYSIILSSILLLAKGKSTFFEIKTADVVTTTIKSDSPNSSQGASVFCAQCGSPVLSTSKFCSKCGSEIPSHE